MDALFTFLRIKFFTPVLVLGVILGFLIACDEQSPKQDIQDIKKAATSFIDSLDISTENKIEAYRWVYFETQTSGGAAFDGKLYFLLKEGNTPPTAVEIKTHPNRMNRTVTVTQEEAAQGTAKVLTKNFTGLSGDAALDDSGNLVAGVTGKGAILKEATEYSVWVMGVASDNTETAIRKLATTLTTQSYAQMSANFTTECSK